MQDQIWQAHNKHHTLPQNAERIKDQKQDKSDQSHHFYSV